MTRIYLFVLLLLATTVSALAQTEKATLYQKPTLNRTHIVFVYAGDLWIVGREGGDAKRLTSGVGTETDPIFSPDGNTIAFTGEYDGNTDVYTIPATGGVPKRLTYHPAADRAVGWSNFLQSTIYNGVGWWFAGACATPYGSIWLLFSRWRFHRL
jgi:tricorn protease